MRLINKLLGSLRPYNGIKTPTIFQLSDTECGIAALAMIFSYYKVHVSLEVLRDQCGASRDGCRATTLIAVAKQYGFDTAAYRVDWDEIAALRCPVIAYWNFKHYVVIHGVGNDKVFINDPAMGAMTVSVEEFDKLFTGIIIVILPTEQTPVIKKKPVLRRMVRQWLLLFYRELFLIFLCALLAMVSPLLLSALSTVFIDQSVIAHHMSWIPYLIVFSLLFSMILFASSVMQRWAQFVFCTKASVVKSAEIIAHVLQLPLIFHALRQKSEMITLLSRVEFIVNSLLKNMTSFLLSLLAVILCLIVMVKINRHLTYLSVMINCISCVIFYGISKFNLSVEKSILSSLGKTYAHSLSVLRNLETIKACSLEMSVIKKWHSLFRQKISLQDKSNTLSAAINVLNQFTQSISMLAVIGLGGIEVARGILSIGYLMAFYGLHSLFCHQLNSIFQVIKGCQSAFVAQSRLQGMMSYKVDRRFSNSSPSVILRDVNQAMISCKDVYFYYNKLAEPILKSINLDIQEGQHVALVGKTGSGKSTLAKLLCGLYQPSKGDLKIYGKNISNCGARELAFYFSYLSQHESLFTGTIYQNLTLGSHAISQFETDQAIQDACLQDLILTRGLHGKIEEQGQNLSGGEIQRLGIARVLLQNTPIIVLDEPTSALDTKTEAVLLDNLKAKMKTIIFVAHRLSTIKHCDQIIVLDKGIMVEQGSHEALMAKKGYYAQLVKNELGCQDAL